MHSPLSALMGNSFELYFFIVLEYGTGFKGYRAFVISLFLPGNYFGLVNKNI